MRGRDRARRPTSDGDGSNDHPQETLGRVVAFFEREGPVAAIGVGSFGPVDRKR